MTTVNSPSASAATDQLSDRRTDSFLDAWASLRQQPTYVILGVQGSGTNLLSRVLRQAFGISVALDRSLICSAAVRVGKNPTAATISREMQHVYQSFFPTSLRRRALPHAYFREARSYKGVEEAIAKATIDSADSFADFWYSYHVFANAADHKGVKSDDIWQYLSHIEWIIPRRRYIRLLRDPRDNALSVCRKDWGPVNPLRAADFVMHQCDIYDEEVASHTDISFVTKYEDLLMRPEAFVRQFSERFAMKPLNGWQESLQQLDIRRENRQKWRSLPPRTLQHLDDKLAHLLGTHGYERTTTASEPPSLSQRTLWYLDDAARRVPQKIGRFWRRRILAP